MFVQVKAGNDAQANDERRAEIESLVEGSLGRFDERLTSVEVFISDENSPRKGGDDDKRCLIEVRPKGLQPIAVRAHGASFDVAVAECLEKMERTLEHRLERLADKSGRVSFAGDLPLGELNGPLPETD